ncbi:MAG TPA: methyl-accepting chemotaxis protein [Burkholderiaceae bacterium]|jgi:methyl-accepting chemotaxis protein
MKNLSIATKMWLPIIGLTLVVLVMITGSVVRTRSLQAQSKIEQENQQTKFELALRWRGMTEANASRALASILSPTEAVGDALKPDIDATTAGISKLQKQLEDLATMDDEKAAMGRIGDTRKAYIAVRGDVIKLRKAGDQDGAMAALKSRMQPAIAAYLDAQQAFVDLEKTLTDKLRQQGLEERMRTLWMTAFAMGLVTAALAASTWRLVRSISPPLAELADLAERIGDGDLSGRIDTARSDEIGVVQRALAQMQTSLSQVVGQVRTSADSIQVASAEIATGNQDLSNRTEQTASNLQQTASSMNHITGTVRTSADSAATANQLATSAAQVAQRGGDVVAQVVSTMNEINASSKKISDIIGTIDGIAFQTNILALNAAVEAARAGEQGRGFAVVAGEVRSLAQRSAEAAKEIKILIGNSVERVEAGARLVQDAGSTMTEIVASVGRVTDIIGEIRASTVEQSEGIGTVNTSVGQLDQMTQQNAALVEQSAAAAESLREQASKLAELVGKFRLQGGAMTAPAPMAVTRKPVPVNPVKAAYKPAPARPAAPVKAAYKPAAPRPAPATSTAMSTVSEGDDWETF